MLPWIWQWWDCIGGFGQEDIFASSRTDDVSHLDLPPVDIGGIALGRRTLGATVFEVLFLAIRTGGVSHIVPRTDTFALVDIAWWVWAGGHWVQQFYFLPQKLMLIYLC